MVEPLSPLTFSLGALALILVALLAFRLQRLDFHLKLFQLLEARVNGDRGTADVERSKQSDAVLKREIYRLLERHCREYTNAIKSGDVAYLADTTTRRGLRSARKNFKKTRDVVGVPVVVYFLTELEVVSIAHRPAFRSPHRWLVRTDETWLYEMADGTIRQTIHGNLYTVLRKSGTLLVDGCTVFWPAVDQEVVLVPASDAEEPLPA